MCGYNAVAAIGEFHPEKINRLFLREDRFKDFTKICKQLAARKRPYKVCEDEELERICKSPHHQGIVAMIEEPILKTLTKEELDDWSINKETGLLLSQVGNDLNLGAIIRSAAFFDCRYIILSTEDKAATVSTGTYRVAEGGMEHVEIRTISRPPVFLKSAARKLFVVGADHRARLHIRDLRDLILVTDKDKKTLSRKSGVLVVMGNEEQGLPPNIKEQCPCLVRIPGTGKIESLNVAQAASLFLHEIFEL